MKIDNITPTIIAAAGLQWTKQDVMNKLELIVYQKQQFAVFLDNGIPVLQINFYADRVKFRIRKKWNIPFSMDLAKQKAVEIF